MAEPLWCGTAARLCERVECLEDLTLDDPDTEIVVLRAEDYERLTNPTEAAQALIEAGVLEPAGNAHKTVDGKHWQVHSRTSLHINDVDAYVLVLPTEEAT
jgi:hypothetical protein